MISFENFMMQDGSPIYLQILLYIKRGIVAGIILDGDELPSRRVLSALLGVNPNTVQKAYKMLEEEGLIQSRTGAKSYVAVTVNKLWEIREELLEDAKLTEYIVKVLIDTPQGSYINNYKVSGEKIVGFLSKFTNRKKHGHVIEIDKYIPDELA